MRNKHKRQRHVSLESELKRLSAEKIKRDPRGRTRAQLLASTLWSKSLAGDGNALKLLLEKGVMGAGAFHTPDCRATYDELKAKGVQFKGEPKEQFYGIEAIITDGCGNWFSMTQPKE